MIRWHLSGHDDGGSEFIAGVYPMLLDETCCFLAMDFDKTGWQQDARAMLETCRRIELPVALERSRSGNGGHVWMFFEDPIPAVLARRLGAHMPTETMEYRPEIGLDSYDRFFPNQDTLPQGGFGNLIALPLQKAARHHGNSVFVDGRYEPRVDQWAFPSSLDRITRTRAEQIVQDAKVRKRIVGVRIARVGGHPFEIGGDTLCNRFLLSAPIDGYGMPSIDLSLLRQVCANGMVGYSPTFRSTLTFGRDEDNAIYSIVRVLDGFASDEGYAALRQRLEAATQPWAIVYEAQSLHRLLVKFLARDNIRRQNGVSGTLLSDADGETLDDRVMNAFHRMTGEVPQLYGLANLDGLSVKRQRTLPVRCRVYDLPNFASELATHHATGDGSRMAQGWIGTLISHEYDLENFCDSFDEFQDFFLERKPGGEAATAPQ